MAITNAQQYKQLVNPPMEGKKRPGYRGEAAAASDKAGGRNAGRSDTGSKSGRGDGPARSGPTNNQVDTGDLGSEEANVKTNIAANLGGSGTSDAIESVNKLQNFLNTRPTVKRLPAIGPFGIVTNLFNKQFQRLSDFSTKKNRDFFQKVIGAGRLNLGGKTINLETVGQMTPEELEKAYQDYMSARSMGEIDAYGNRITKSGDGPDPIPFIPPVVSEPEIKLEPGYVNPLSLLTPRIAGTRFLGTEFEDEDKAVNLRLAGGGIASLDDMDREGFLLGGIAKGLKKAVRGIKKLAKSPIGKAAIAAAAIKFGGGLFGPKGAGKFLYSPVQGSGSIFSKFPGGKIGAGIFGISALAGAMTPKEDEDKFDLAKYYGDSQLEPSQSIRGMGSEFDFYGGERMRVAEGGSTEKEPVAKKTMPLLDMDGMEKDYREEGGFVPIGRMEKADDVPARLSKNEFVFTADAVRNAGDGDVDKGAEVMYNMMKNLESGGDVSEESQGLEGAREMFQTSQRLGEVI